ncbi:CobB/CobQ-like glutamine amidotransferase domain-containing protein [Pelagophyceae sp. CCMP2097]|nr:CobB/CobQ-like glutamine amidotransferase domain-containing protein [Pelagophyceae sp. CCMP2097]
MESLVQRTAAALAQLPEGPSRLRLFRREAAAPSAAAEAIRVCVAAAGQEVQSVEFEACFNVEFSAKPQDAARAAAVVCFLVAETFDVVHVALETFVGNDAIEVGPRRTFATAFSSTACSICAACGVPGVSRLERSRRYGVDAGDSAGWRAAAAAALHDRMTECVWEGGATSSMRESKRDAGSGIVDVKDLRAANKALSLGFDDFDCDYYSEIFGERLGRNPTHAELYDMSQSNSEHSRHWFFSGVHVIDGESKAQTLFQMVKGTLKAAEALNNDVSLIAFNDNSSAIRGGAAQRIAPSVVGAPSPFAVVESTLNGLLTAETHNFPCAVAPLPGAETGTGGRIRDVQATGRGAHVVAGVAGYCVGNLNLPEHAIAGEDATASYPAHLASPAQILIDASNGASDYGNKFGEPVIVGVCRTYGGVVGGERSEWIKPIMFSAGVGWIHDEHLKKEAAAPGMLVAKVGGPAYPIGMGGGAASSRVSTEADVALDFDAVQRGDAQMCNRMNRVIRACCELGSQNPIAAIHDQGCGGNANVLKEIVEGAGAEYKLSKFSVGDETMTALEIWGAEYQESNGILLHARDEAALRALCDREKCLLDVVGVVSKETTVRVIDDRPGGNDALISDLPLELVMEKLPPKTFRSDTPARSVKPLAGKGLLLDLRQALKAVLGLPRVCSKRFLVHKVDRSVGGLIARQQCVGPLQLPLSNCAVIARSHLSTEGCAIAVGEAPQLTNLSPERMARVSVAEMMTNLCFARISKRQDIRLSANWMWAAKLPGEGAKMYAACSAMCEALIEVQVAVDGGKDSLSMAAPDASGNTVKGPGALVLTAYAHCVDIAATVTPDLKLDDGVLVLIDLGAAYGLGGSALAQACGEHGASTAPDAHVDAVAKAFDVVQQLIADGLVSAGHDRSDGGLVVALLEMAFAGCRGFSVDVPAVSAEAADDVSEPMMALFHEAPGIILEISQASQETVSAAFAAAGLAQRYTVLGSTCAARRCVVAVGGASVLDESAVDLWLEWESTSFALEKRQRDAACAQTELDGLRARRPPVYKMTFEPPMYSIDLANSLLTPKHRVAVVRCEGSNGDREMAAAFFVAGLEPWDVTMNDLAAGRVSLDAFRGLAFVGGFSFADVFDSAKGWAATIRYNSTLKPQFERFRERTDTFSLGVCNGCQLLALLGWVSPAAATAETAPRFVHNSSGKFESRWLSVAVLESPSVLLRGMAGSTLGVWVAHGEGKLHLPTAAVADAVFGGNLAPLRYADDAGEPTAQYPFCPNGAAGGAAALCSADGRHLAMMPHPERCVAPWQQPYSPPNYLGSSAWLRLFQNARTWLDGEA